MKCKLQKKTKKPGNRWGVTGGNEGVYDEQPILFISHKNACARLRRSENKKPQKLKTLIMCYN
jgi:hypothetical protein